VRFKAIEKRGTLLAARRRSVRWRHVLAHPNIHFAHRLLWLSFGSVVGSIVGTVHRPVFGTDIGTAAGSVVGSFAKDAPLAGCLQFTQGGRLSSRFHFFPEFLVKCDPTQPF